MKHLSSYIKKCLTGTYLFWLSVLIISHLHFAQPHDVTETCLSKLLHCIIIPCSHLHEMLPRNGHPRIFFFFLAKWSGLWRQLWCLPGKCRVYVEGRHIDPVHRPCNGHVAPIIAM